jgi:serine/threonine-protein kinase
MQGVVASPGRELAGRYTLERELGRGGTATVYLATDARHRRRVAVKILRPDVAAALGRERFLREIDIAARLSHPHILPLHDSGESDGLVFYVMPYVEGETLRERIRREGPLPLDDALRITREVADALAYAHRSGVVHRDIKPGNILLHAGHAVVADFGIARAISAATGETTREEITSHGMIIGTPAYLSPEQATHGAVDARTDIYALGCVLHEMLSGEAPFIARSPQAVVAAHLHQRPTPLRVLRSTVPAEVEAAVLVALEKRPADRFPDAPAFVAALGGESRPAVTRRTARRRRLLLGGGALAVAAGAAIWGWTRDATVLDPNRVLVLPMAGPGPDSAGQRDAATLALIASLNSTSSIVGLDGAKIAAAGPLAPARARRLARTQRAAFLVDASLLRADSLRLLLNVEDLRDGSLVHYVVGFAPGIDAWAIGVRAALELLPTVLHTTRPAELPSLTGRSPAAMAEYFLGEGAYRRAAFTEALAHFRRAVEVDSTFALAALRGAQAANWLHQQAETQALIGVALAYEGVLPPRFRELTRGLDDFVHGRADSAVARFRRAAALDPTAAEPWMWLGETYHHLLPRASPLDTLAEASYRKVHDLDSTFAPVLYHLIELAARRGDRVETRRLLDAYRAGNPDPDLVGGLELVAR